MPLAPTDWCTPPSLRLGASAGPRAVDLLIAATAVANGIPLYTRNADDVRFLDGLVEVVEV